MILKDIGMVAAPSLRSKAYIQALVNHKLYPSYVILLEDNYSNCKPEHLLIDNAGFYSSKQKKHVFNQLNNPYFKYDENMVETLKTHDVSFEVCRHTDINSKEFIQVLKNRPESFFIYSGYGGTILRKDVLSCGKRFIHIHSGKLPEYKGSTTIYYSILNEGQCFATVFFIDEQIDHGEIIKIKKYPMPTDGENIDYVYDSYIRSDALVETIKEYAKQNHFVSCPQKGESEIFYIIHPILKHIAIISCKQK